MTHSAEHPHSRTPISRFYPYFVIVIAALFFFYEFILMTVFDPLNLTLREAFHVDALQISNLSAMYYYANVLFLIPAGLILDRFSTKKLLMLGMVVSSTSTFLFAISHHYDFAAATRFATGITGSFCLLSCIKLSSRWLKPEHCGVMLGFVVSLAMLGGVVGQLMPQLIHLTGSWRHALMAVSGLGLCILLLITVFVRDYPKGQEDRIKAQLNHLRQEGFWPAFFEAAKNHLNWMGGIYTLILSIPINVIAALWGIDYLHVARGLSFTDAAWVASLIFFGVMLGSTLFGWISDQMKRRKAPMIIGASFTLIISLILVLDHHLSTESIAVLFFLLGFFCASQSIVYAYLIEVNPKHITASAESFSSVIIMLTGVIFAPLFGKVLEIFWTGEMANGIQAYSPHAYYSAMWILPIAFVCAVVIAFFLKETYCRSIFD